MLAIYLPIRAPIPISTSSSPFLSHRLFCHLSLHSCPRLLTTKTTCPRLPVLDATLRPMLPRHQPSNPASLPLSLPYRSKSLLLILPFKTHTNGKNPEQKPFDSRRSAQDASKDESGLMSCPVRLATQPFIMQTRMTWIWWSKSSS